MATKLTLSIKNKHTIDNAKKYAKKSGRSLSSVVESYLNAISVDEKNSEEKIMSEISPAIRALVGIAKNVPRNKNYKELVTEYLTEKYLK